jgi:hypothetical protein
MSDTVLIVLIIALAVIIVLFAFRGALSRFFLKASREGFEAELQTRDPAGGQQSELPKEAAEPPSPGVNISGNVQRGSGHRIAVNRPDVNVSDNEQSGRDQSIEVGSDQPTDE